VLLDKRAGAGSKTTAGRNARRPLDRDLNAGVEQQALDSEVISGRADDGNSPRLPGVASLDEVIEGAWRSLELGQTTACPVCGGSLDLYRFNETEAGEGFCVDCGSELR
jgi:hypothetical protein